MKVQVIDPTTGAGVDLNNMMFGSDCVEYTPADADLPAGVKAVIFAGDGTISYKNTSGGSAITGFPVLNGQPISFIPLRVTAMTGATKCFLISGNR